MKNSILFTVFFASMFLLCCKKKVKNSDTFYCKINGGEYLIDVNDPSKHYELGSKLMQNGKLLTITAKRDFEMMTITLIDTAGIIDQSTTLTEKTFTLKNGNNVNSSASYWKNSLDLPVYNTDADNTGTFNLKLDPGGNTITGTFNFYAKNLTTNHTILADTGSFNIKYVVE